MTDSEYPLKTSDCSLVKAVASLYYFWCSICASSSACEGAPHPEPCPSRPVFLVPLLCKFILLSQLEHHARLLSFVYRWPICKQCFGVRKRHLKKIPVLVISDRKCLHYCCENEGYEGRNARVECESMAVLILRCSNKNQHAIQHGHTAQ